MRHLKTLGLLAVAVAALMALAGSASATTITSPTGTVATPTIHWENEGGHINVANPIANILCNQTITGTVTSHGAGATVEGHISSSTYSGCTNGWHVTVLAGGRFTIHWTSGYNGVVTFTFYKFTATRLGINCTYETNATPMGTITGGNPATTKIEASIPINTAESSGLCGTGNAKAEGSLVTTSALYIDQ